MRYEIVPSEPNHVILLRESLREDDAREVVCMGLTVRKGLWRSYRNSVMRHTAFVDGQIAAMWGMGGQIISPIGTPWLMTTKAVEKIPLSFFREARQHLAQMLECKESLKNYVAADYDKAVRFLSLLGFKIGEPEPFGLRGAMFRPCIMERS